MAPKSAASSSAKAKIGVLGASGYTGSELVRLLLRHPRVEIALLTADRAPGRRCARCFRNSRRSSCRSWCRSTASTGRRPALDLVFCALPHATTQKVIKRSAGARRRRPRWSICRPTSGCTTPRPTRSGTATSITRRSCRRRRSTAWSRSIGDDIKKARLVANPGCYTSCAQLAADAAAQGQGDRARRDRDRRQVRHDRGGAGGQGGDAVLRSVGRLPRLWRRPSPAHGRARPGVLAGRRARGDRDASRRIWCR